MTLYEQKAQEELLAWQMQMASPPSFTNRLARKAQIKLNSYIPERVHKAISDAIRQMVKAVLFGSRITSGTPITEGTLEQREMLILDRIQIYKNTGAAEGGIAGAGGFLLALAEFPVLLGTKVKMLFDVSTFYGFDVHDYRERLFLLYLFQLAFSSQQRRNEVYIHVTNWKEKAQALPPDINDFDWRGFQQEYRDYIDIAKIAQLVPIIGAAVGVIVNYRLIDKLGVTAMNGFRMRLTEEGRSDY